MGGKIKTKNLFPSIFTLILLLLVFLLVWNLPASSQQSFLLQDVKKSLETSQGRERKQQKEYDETIAEIPRIEAELNRVIPLAEEAQTRVNELKARRNQLREEKKRLESQLQSLDTEETGHE